MQDTISIKVNGVAISEDAVAVEMQHHSAATRDEAMRCAAEALVVREALLQEVKRLAIGEPTELAPGESSDEGRIRRLIEQQLQVPEPDEVPCRTYFENNRQRFRSEDRYQVSHILLAAAPWDAEAREDAKSRGEQILGRLQAAPEQFAELARRHSACPSRQQGGSLGQIGRGQTVPEFEAYLARAEVGVLPAHMLETRYGYHIVLLHRRVRGHHLSFELVEHRIRHYLRDSVMRRELAQYVRSLLAKARIEGIDMSARESFT